MSQPTGAERMRSLITTATALVGYNHAVVHLRGMRDAGVGVPWFLIGRLETELREHARHWGWLFGDVSEFAVAEAVDHATKWLEQRTEQEEDDGQQAPDHDG
jgi:hypothetical protein